jgi:hypothetical protein
MGAKPPHSVLPTPFYWPLGKGNDQEHNQVHHRDKEEHHYPAGIAGLGSYPHPPDRAHHEKGQSEK